MSTKCYNEYTKKRTSLLKTRKVKIMTKKVALSTAITALKSMEIVDTEAVETLTKMIDQLEKARTPMSDEKKAAVNAKRKEATAQARAELLSKVVPILRKYLSGDVTAKELFEAAKDELPEGFSAPKVQNILIREMASEVVKTEAKGKANTYRLA